MTGAARSALRVNTPAVAQLVALTRRATSSARSDLRPAWAAPAEKPPGDVEVDVWYDEQGRLARQESVEDGHRMVMELVRVRR